MQHPYSHSYSNKPIGVPRPDEQDHLPLRMVSEYAYCPRLFHLMRVDGLWADNAYTVDGRRVHRRIDSEESALPEAGGEDEPQISRSVTLSSPTLGIIGKLDLVTTEGCAAVPVETKRGRVPNNPERSWEPERVQLMAQGLLLREHGFTCDQGILYYAESRERVSVLFTEELEARTRHLIEQAKIASRTTKIPDPLEDSPKCHGCSLSGICLPDETLTLAAVPEDKTARGIRRLYPARNGALPLYVQEQGAKIGKSGRTLIVRKSRQEIAVVRLKDVSQLVLCGSVEIGAQALHLLAEAGVPVVHLSKGHWFYGITQGFGLRNAYDRAAQYAVAAEPQQCLALAKSFVFAKGSNQRTLLRRNARPAPTGVLNDMAGILKKLPQATSLQQVLGFEGNLARLYFSGLPSMLRPTSGSLGFSFSGRNRRPPKDPINALLSFGYALLAKECTVAASAVGLDPFWGFFHQPRHGRPALALDLMEEFRPLIVDSAVLTAVNTGMLTRRNFTIGSNGCALGPSGRKSMIKAYEARLDQLVTHPRFEYKCSWRQVIRLQAQILARFLRGDVRVYDGMVTR